MAVEVTLTIASREFRILGSGTCSTLIFRLPCQQFARIAISLSRDLVQPGDAASPPSRFSLGRDRFAGLDHLLKAAQLLVDDLRGPLADQRSSLHAKWGLAEIHSDANDRPAMSRSCGELHFTGVGQLRFGKRSPTDCAAGHIFYHLGFPFHARSVRQFRNPVGGPLTADAYRLHAAQKARQVFEISPEAIAFLRRAIYDQARLRLSPPACFALHRGRELPRAPDVERRDSSDGREPKGGLAALIAL